jgi:hypothetical protein
MTSTSDRRRAARAKKIEDRYDYLMGMPASMRTRKLNQEFGPYWYWYLLGDGPMPDEMSNSERRQRWNAEQSAKISAKMKQTKSQTEERRAMTRAFFNNQRSNNVRR